MSKAEDKKVEEEEELVIVGEGDDEAAARQREQAAAESEAEEGEESEESEESEAGDERVGHAEGEEDDGGRRRLSHKERRQRQRESRDRDRAELKLLRSRNEVLERRFSSMDQRLARSETVAIDQRINQIKGQIQVADEVIAAATDQNRGKDVVEAQNIKDQLREALGQLEGVRGQVIQTARVRASRDEAPDRGPRLDQNGLSLGQAWARSNPWFRQDMGDEDSAITSAIDNTLTAEGRLDPNTPEYWAELTRRVKRRLPHRFKGRVNGSHEAEDDSDEEVEVRRTPAGPRFASGGRDRPLRKNEVYVSPERKAAMVEAGVWDDPVLRKKYLKRYQEYDREHTTRQ